MLIGAELNATLDPRQAAEMNVNCGKAEHHQKGRQGEQDAGECGSHRTGPTQPRYIANCAASGPGENSEKPDLEVVLLRPRTALFHQVPLHVIGERDSSAKADGAEAQE